MDETADLDSFAQFTPAVVVYQAGEDLFQGDPMQGIVLLCLTHIPILS